MKTASVFVVSLALVVTACSVTQETTPANVQLDADIAKSQASALSTAVASAEAGDGIALAEELASVGDMAAALVPDTKKGARDRIKRATTTCSCSEQSCAFAGCTLGAAKVSGSLSWAGGRIHCEKLAFDVAATSSSIGAARVEVSCDLTYATGHVAGSLKTTGNAVVDDVSYAWDAKLAINDVTFTSTTFTGGSLDVGAAVTTFSEDDGSKSFSASAVVSLLDE
jgi:hypothetical protein